MHFFKYFIKK